LRPLSRLLTTSGSLPKSGPFPPPELPGFAGTTSLSATPHGPACPSRVAGRWLVPAPPGLPVLREKSCANVPASFTPAAGCGASVWLAAPRSLRCPPGPSSFQAFPVRVAGPLLRLAFSRPEGNESRLVAGARWTYLWTPTVQVRSGPLARRVPKGPSSPRASAKSLPP